MTYVRMPPVSFCHRQQSYAVSSRPQLASTTAVANIRPQHSSWHSDCEYRTRRDNSSYMSRFHCNYFYGYFEKVMSKYGDFVARRPINMMRFHNEVTTFRKRPGCSVRMRTTRCSNLDAVVFLFGSNMSCITYILYNVHI